MAEMTPELRAAIDVAKQRIKVDTYYPRAMNASLKGNAQGYWAGTALGFATGGLAGALIAGGVALFTIPVTIPLYAIVLGLAGVGGTMGGMTGARIGAGAGSTAASTAELERRLRADTLEQEILKSPEKQRAAIAAYRKDPVVERTDTVCETYATTRGKGNAFKKIVDWKTMLVTVAVCTLASMALFGGAFLLGAGAGLGALGMTSIGSALAIGAGAGAAMGVAFGVAYPPIFASLTKHTADLLSGKMVRGKSQFGHIKNVAEIEAEATLNRELSEGVVPQMHVAHKAPVAADMPSMQVSDVVAADRVAQPQQQITA
jgi:hypothetical protein